ncbi:hypothetical protein DE146DRAFT_626935 [Phaeosphaeria sp. MPI-PUGE-AT-0046c]|nr:hypothetical protein DE146DRAFT_626935 [Phaeosphaeria sp. MPI-PUGE-AT-0046c]
MLPPTPPPLPPRRASQRTENVKLVSSPSSNFVDVHEHVVVNKALNSNTLALERAEKIARPFHPCYMFFYGSLMDSEVIQAILGLSEIPTTSPAVLSGFKIKMWGIYPALVPGTNRSDQVSRRVWKVSNEDHFDLLAAYETVAYTWVECEARLDDGAVLKDCRTFCWTGIPDSNELEDGAFDLERYQKFFKSSVVRRK